MWAALRGASAVVLVTEWPALVELDWKRVRAEMTDPAIIFDGRNALDRASIEAAGLSYMDVGRPGSHRL